MRLEEVKRKVAQVNTFVMAERRSFLSLVNDVDVKVNCTACRKNERVIECVEGRVVAIKLLKPVRRSSKVCSLYTWSERA